MSRTQDLSDASGSLVRVPNRGVLMAAGVTVPPDGTPGYADGCLFIDVDAATAAQWWRNDGTNLSSLFVNVATVGVSLSGLVATAGLLNIAADPTSGGEVVTATNVITAAESGKTFFLNSATEFVSTLPAPALGLKYKFIVSAAPSGASYTVICAASGTLIKGHVLTNDVNSATDADFGTSGELTLTFVDGKAVAGDWAEFQCDGTNWFVQAGCSVFDAITIS